MPKHNGKGVGKKKSKKGKGIAKGQGGGSSTTLSPEQMFASLSNASPEDLDVYLHQLFELCEKAGDDQENGMDATVLTRSKVREAEFVIDDQLPGTSDGNGIVDDALHNVFPLPNITAEELEYNLHYDPTNQQLLNPPPLPP
ncbi:MAG: hypothetical protein GY706_03675, partial [Bacteroides sp.]|nr:hypothetical protein [Bacteroides sp.]